MVNEKLFDMFGSMDSKGAALFDRIMRFKLTTEEIDDLDTLERLYNGNWVNMKKSEIWYPTRNGVRLWTQLSDIEV